jgi:YjbE family integral membrane protein
MELDLTSAAFWIAVGQIILIDIVLSGDNAVVIALACRNLSPEQRRKGILWGVAGAVSLRVVLTVFAALVMNLPWLKLVGGLLLVWIAVKLMLPEDEEGHDIEPSAHLWGAVKTIVVADFVMSLDNVIAVAGAAHGSLGAAAVRAGRQHPADRLVEPADPALDGALSHPSCCSAPVCSATWPAR